MLLPIVAVAAVALFFLARKSAPGGVEPVWIPVRWASGEVDPRKAKWHASDDQTKQFGPRRPDYWSLNGYFVFSDPGGGQYKPDWQVPLESGH